MSTFDPRSPGTYSSFSNDKTYDTDSDTPTDSSASSGLLRRVAFSPHLPGTDDSFADRAEVEAALTELDVDAEISATQDAVSQWSSHRPSHTSFTTSTPYSGTESYSGTSTSYLPGTGTATEYFTRDPRVLSTISERTENPSRPTSFAQNRLSTQRLSTHSKSHTRSTTEANANVNRLSAQSQGHTRGATDLPTTSRRAGDLIAFFEDRAGTPGKEKERITSPFLPPNQSTPHLGSTTGYSSTGYGYTTGFTSTGYGYTTGTGGYTTTGYTTSRPTSPTKSRSSDSRSTVSTSSGGGGSDLSLSSLLSPPVRGFATTTGTFSGSVTATATPPGRTQLSPSDFASTFSSAFGVARGRQDDTTPTRQTQTQTQTALRRNPAPQKTTNTSPRSPLTSVRNIVAAWKERTPGIDKVKSESSEGGSELSPPVVPKMEGLFSLRRRASRRGPRGELLVTPDKNAGNGNGNEDHSSNRENEGNGGNLGNGMRRRMSSLSSLIPPPFDMTDLGARENREPIRIGALWYLNVHSPTPYRWEKCSALLYPHVLILSWNAPGGGRGIVSLDLLNCTEVRSTPGFTHPGARGDVGGVSAAAQVTDDGVSLVEVLCPFQLLYADGVERLAAESARERVRWVSAIWEALDRSLTLPNRSQSGSPTGSIRTIRSMTSSTSISGESGSRSTVFVPPLHTIPSLSDLESSSPNLTGGLSLSASRSVGGHAHTRTTDDTSYLYPSDPRIIAPSRSSSLRRTSSLTDLDEEFASAVSRARSAKPGLGFGLSLVNDALSSEGSGILGVGEGSPVTVSSGPRLWTDVRVTPPPTGKMKSRALSVSEEEFFSAGSRTSSVPGSRPDSDFFSAESSRTSSRDGSGGQTTTGLVTDETAFEFTSGGSNTQIVPSTLSYRRTESNSYLGDSHDGSRSYTPYTSSDTRSRTPYSYSSSGYTSSTPYTYTSGSYTPTPTSPSLSRSAEVRRRRYGAYTSGGLSDRENSGTTRSTLSGWTRSRTPTTTTEGILVVEERESSGSEGYNTAHDSPSPSTASFKSLPTIPSESDYQTLETCKTCVSSEFVTAEVCASDVETEYVTAEKCKTETETDYWTAELCKSDREETQYETASVCRTIPSEEGLSTPKSVLVVELPPAEEPIDLYEEGEVPPTPPPKTLSEVPSVVSEESPPDVSVEAVTAHEEIVIVVEEESLLGSGPHTDQPIESPTPPVSFHTDSSASYPPTGSDVSAPQTQPDASVSTVTELSDLTPSESPRSERAPTISVSEEEAITPSVHPSQWPAETDVSFDSSALQPTPSVQSVVLQEGIDASFETSFMRPSVSPLSSIARLTPITETVSSLAPSPTMLRHLPQSVSSPSSGPTPLTVSTSGSSSLSRTPSSVTDVSILDTEVDEAEGDAMSVRAASDISTVPSLLSTRSEESMRYVQEPSSPWNVPLPETPAPPSVSMSVSMTTPHDDTPSIHSVLETEDTRTHTEQTITHDIDRLLHHIHEIDQFRGQETQEISENVRAIRDELYDLSEYVRARLVGERPPPVATRDTSVGGSSVHASPVPDPGAQTLGITYIEMPPPRVHPSSPGSLSSGSFLSSYHSDDDLSLWETELDVEPVPPREPSGPSSSSSSSITPSEISSSEPSPGPSLSATSSSSPTPPPSSPTPSTESSVTVRQREDITIETLRDMLTSLREQTTALWEGQVSTNHMLDELRQTRAGPLDTTEFNERLQAIEALLQQLMDRQVQPERPVSISPPSESISEVGTLDGFIPRLGTFLGRVPVVAPQPRRPRANLDDELLALLQAPPPQVATGVQPPPALIPFMYQPASRPARSRSPSPPPRAQTFPIPGERVLFEPEILHRPHRGGRGRGQHRPTGRTDAANVPPTETTLSPPTGAHTRLPAGPRQEVQNVRLRTNIPSPRPIPLDLHGRAPSAPGNLEPPDDVRMPQSWYRQGGLGGGVPPPPIFNAREGGPQFVPMPPGPTVVQLPLFDTLMNILREHRLAQLATVDQQRELMRYMRGLNEWLERDVQDRHAELLGVTSRVDELRNDLARLGLGMQPGVQPPVHPSMQMPQPHVQPDGGVVPGAVIPGGFAPPPPGFVTQGPPVIPTYGASPQPHQYVPVIPGTPFDRQQMPAPVIPGTPWDRQQMPAPVIPGTPWDRQQMPEPGYPYPPGGPGGPVRPHDEHHPPHRTHHDHPEDGFIPSRPGSGSSGSGPGRPVLVEQPTYIVTQSPEGSFSSSETQQTYAVPQVHHVHHPEEGVVHMAPSHQGDIIPVHHSGEHIHSHGSPQPHTTIINVPPTQAPGQVMSDQPPFAVPLQPSYVQPPPGMMMPGQPLIIHPSGPVQQDPVFIHPSRSSSRGSVVLVPDPGYHSPSRDHVIITSPSHLDDPGRSHAHTPVTIPPSSVVLVPPPEQHTHSRPHGRSRSPTYYDDPRDRRRRYRRGSRDSPDSYYYPERHRTHDYPSEGPPRGSRRRDSYSGSPSRRPSEREGGSRRLLRRRDRTDDAPTTEGDAGRRRDDAPITEGDAGRRRDDDPDYSRRRRDSPSYRRTTEGDTGHRRDDDPDYSRRRRDSPSHRPTTEGDTGHRRDDDPDRRSRRDRRRDSRSPTSSREGDPGHRRDERRRLRRRDHRRDSRSPTSSREEDSGHRRDDRRGRHRRDHRRDSRSPLSSEERDGGHRRHPSRRSPSYEEGDAGRRRHPSHRRTPSYEEGDVGHRLHPSHRITPSYEEGDHPRPERSHGVPSRTPSRRTAPEYIEGDAPGHHVHIHTHTSPPRSTSQPTIIGIGHPETGYPPDTYRPVILSPVRTHRTASPEPHRYPAPLSPSAQLEHDLRHVRPETGYIPTVPSEAGRSRRRSPVTMADEPDPHGHRGGPHGDHGDPHGGRGDPHEGHGGISRGSSRTGRVPSAIREEYDDGHPPSEGRGPHSRGPSRAGRTIREGDDGRPPSDMVHVPEPLAPHTPRTPSQMHFEPGAEFDDALHQRHERLDDAERELTQIVHDAHEAENRREGEFRQNEDAREQLFIQNEDRREAEARERSNAIFAQLEERAQSVPPLPVPPPVHEDSISIIESMHEAASRHASEILETVRLEREQFDRERAAAAAEREQERAELEAERARMDEERAQRIHDLEEELAHVRGDLDNERQLRQTENEERMAVNERDEGMRAQLGDITQLVSEQRDECARKKELMDQRWEEKEGRRAEKDAQFRELKDMVVRLIQDQEADRIQAEDRRRQDEEKPDIQVVLDQLNRQNAEMREALDILSENWRNEGERRHQETLDAVRATAREQVPFNIQMYLDEFSKALATEVRMLLGEVGKLREERRNIQHELGYLMMMKAKYGPGGEFDPEWKPPMPGPGPDAPPPPDPPAPPPEEHPASRPAWRTVPRGTRRIRKSRPDAPPPEPVAEPSRPSHASWIAWHPNPALAPTPPSIEPTLLVPGGSPGLFGPRSPHSSYHR